MGAIDIVVNLYTEREAGENSGEAGAHASSPSVAAADTLAGKAAVEITGPRRVRVRGWRAAGIEAGFFGGCLPIGLDKVV